MDSQMLTSKEVAAWVAKHVELRDFSFEAAFTGKNSQIALL